MRGQPSRAKLAPWYIRHISFTDIFATGKGDHDPFSGLPEKSANSALLTQMRCNFSWATSPARRSDYGK
jgi:hypothetical protein